MRAPIVALAMCLFILPVQAQYSGGTGEPNDPYQIATAEDLIALGETSEDYDKHFILTADINLDPNLPGRRVFDRAVIAADTDDAEPLFQGTPFTGVLDGNKHTISNMVIAGGSHLGLFGATGLGAIISNLGLEAVDLDGTGNHVGALVGGSAHVGSAGSIIASYSTGVVSGRSSVGGLVGLNCNGSISGSYSTGTVNGEYFVAGLIGQNLAHITDCYSTARVMGDDGVGGLVGLNVGSIAMSYSTGAVTCRSSVGGLVGEDPRSRFGDIGVTSSFWDIETSGQTNSAGGIGKTTAEMQTLSIFLDAGWDFVCETVNGIADIWWMPEGEYPGLVWEVGEVPACSVGVVELDETNFGETVGEGVVLVDFYATWCSHCRTQAPILDEVAEEVGSKAVVGKLDIDQARSVAQAYGVTAIPTLIVFKNGNVFERFLGVTQAPSLVAAIQAAIEHEEVSPR